MKTRKIQLMGYNINSRSHNGTVTFNKTRSTPEEVNGGTEYHRFYGYVLDDQGAPLDLKLKNPVTGKAKDVVGIIMLNANTVENLCGLPAFAANATIEVSETDFNRSLVASAQSKGDFDQFTLVFSTFDWEPHEDALEYKRKIAAELKMEEAREAKKAQKAWRKKISMEIVAGQRPNLAETNTQENVAITGQVAAGILAGNPSAVNTDPRPGGQAQQELIDKTGGTPEGLKEAAKEVTTGGEGDDENEG